MGEFQRMLSDRVAARHQANANVGDMRLSDLTTDELVEAEDHLTYWDGEGGRHERPSLSEMIAHVKSQRVDSEANSIMQNNYGVGVEHAAKSLANKGVGTRAFMTVGAAGGVAAIAGGVAHSMKASSPIVAGAALLGGLAAGAASGYLSGKAREKHEARADEYLRTSANKYLNKAAALGTVDRDVAVSKILGKNPGLKKEDLDKEFEAHRGISGRAVGTGIGFMLGGLPAIPGYYLGKSHDNRQGAESLTKEYNSK